MPAISHTVVAGDTLSEIAAKYKGDYGYTDTYKYMNVLVSLNNIANPNMIVIGQVIKLTGTASGTSSSTTKSVNNNAPIIDAFGLISSDETKLYATWTWGKEHETKEYKFEWDYRVIGNNTWFIGNHGSNSVDSDNRAASHQTTWDIPANAAYIRFRVKPIAETTKDSNKNEVPRWKANWSGYKSYYNRPKTGTPSAPSIKIDKYKLTATIDDVDAEELNATTIQFQVVKIVNNKISVFNTGSSTIDKSFDYVSYSCNVGAGVEYKVRCRAYGNTGYSDWSDFSETVGTIPATPQHITTCKANSETSVYLAWVAVTNAKSYDIEYTTKKSYFDNSDETSTKTGIEFTHFEVTGLESGQEYFFRIRAVNDGGASAWSAISSVAIGKAPAAPTTWSSTTTATVGEALNLYWVHNAEDNSSQTMAELELTVDGKTEVINVVNTTDEEEKDKTSVYSIDTSKYTEGVKILWRVRTMGIISTYGDWSVQRTIDIYAPPVLELTVSDASWNQIDTLESFPFHISALPGPDTQKPTSYHVSITANESYETVDNIGNEKYVNAGDEIYSRFFDISHSLRNNVSAGDISLENGMSYTVTCTVSMDSGLTATSSTQFFVSWGDDLYFVNAEISINDKEYTANIRPYCEEHRVVFYRVNYDSTTDKYTFTTEDVEIETGVPVLVEGVLDTEWYYAYTETGEQVFTGTTTSGDDIYYCTVEESFPVEDVTLSVYRREYDGTFTEIATDLDNTMNVTVTDPHPSLDYARYRIVATSIATGSVSFYDMPGVPVNCHSIIIQWDDDWSNFDTNEDAAVVEPSWAGSLLNIPYNIDVSNNNDSDVTTVSYIGRKHPVSYYGTQLGEKASWSVEIPKSDKETLYGIRRLAIWMGDVYVREPSGSGYWATIKVSYSQKHCETTIPVSFEITRVEGGI